MINLLPPDLKSSYRYARHNRTLVHWIILMSVSLVIAGGLVAGGYLFLNQQIHNTTRQIATSNAQLNAENIGTVQKQVTSISGNLKLAISVLSQEVLFSQLLKQLASVTPNNVILTNLSISQTVGGVDITAETANYQDATQLQVNLSDPKNQIFTKADIVSINCSAQSATSGKYPCTATLRALFAANNPFLFINSGSKSKK